MTRQNQREKACQAVRTALQQPGVAASAIFLKDGDARTDRFDMVVEVYCRDGAMDDVIGAVRSATATFVTAAPVVAGSYREVVELGVEAKR
jgi:hypothetical protein